MLRLLEELRFCVLSSSGRGWTFSLGQCFFHVVMLSVCERVNPAESPGSQILEDGTVSHFTLYHHPLSAFLGSWILRPPVCRASCSWPTPLLQKTLTGSQPTWLLSHTYRLLIGLRREHAQPRHSTFFSDGQGNMLPTTCACSWKHVHARTHTRTLHRGICSPVWRQTDRAPLRRDLSVSGLLGKKIEEAVVRG